MSRMRDPELEFGDPRRLADDRALTIREKLDILENWKSDLIELQVAEEENMASAASDPGKTAGRLAEVTQVIAALRERLTDEDAPAVAEGVRQPPRKPYRPGQDVPKPYPVDSPDPPGPKSDID